MQIDNLRFPTISVGVPIVTIKISVHVQTQLTDCWSREGESTGQTRGKIVNEWLRGWMWSY